MTSPVLTLTALQDSRHALVAPFSLPLPNGVLLECEAILRLMPGKRLVVKATYNGNTVLAKIFFQSRNWQQEISGYHLLKETGVKTPALLQQMSLGVGGLCLYEFLADAQAFDSVWQHADEQKKVECLRNLLGLLQQLYGARCVQTDLHPGNFVYAGDVLYALDPASCAPMANENALQDNLALLLAQMPLECWALGAREMAQSFPAIDTVSLRKCAEKKWHVRKRNYLKKIFRECSDVADLSQGGQRILCRRSAINAGVRALLDDPEQAIDKGKILKDSRSTTVALVSAGEARYVIKRYHNANAWTALRRKLRKSRVANNWYFAHLLGMLNIPTPAPVAMIVQRRSVLDYSGYYISEYVEADNAYNVFTKTLPAAQQQQAVRRVFESFARSGICHGDCKTTNWLVQGDAVMLVDLDAMHETKNIGNTDRARFLRDWQGHAELETLFAQVLDGLDVQA